MKTKEAVNVVSIEDPVEVRLPDVRQVEVSPKKNITFASAIRSFLRHDPDVMLIGEIRDKETAQEAIRASQTGHLVFSTIHTNTACGVIARLVDLGSSEEFIASALRAVISQRLVRALCPNCRKKVVAPPHLSMIEYVYQPVGCDRCEGEGYKGRIVLWELLLITDTVRQAILRKVYADEDLMLKESGTESMQEVAQESLRLGRTSLEEVERFVVMGSLAGRVFSSGHFVREGV
jgi:type II secretory ATPase GspE/PulE/Tfp pilus assembly ATPase PilB-like protein